MKIIKPIPVVFSNPFSTFKNINGNVDLMISLNAT